MTKSRVIKRIATIAVLILLVGSNVLRVQAAYPTVSGYKANVGTVTGRLYNFTEDDENQEARFYYSTSVVTDELIVTDEISVNVVIEDGYSGSVLGNEGKTEITDGETLVSDYCNLDRYGYYNYNTGFAIFGSHQVITTGGYAHVVYTSEFYE